MELNILKRLTDSVIDINENITFFSELQSISVDGTSVTITAPAGQKILLTDLFSSVETKRVTLEVNDVPVNAPVSTISKTEINLPPSLSAFRIGKGGLLDNDIRSGEFLVADKVKITAGDGTAAVRYAYLFINNPLDKKMAILKTKTTPLIVGNKIFTAGSSSVTITAPAGQKVILESCWVAQGNTFESGIAIRRNGVVVHSGMLKSVDSNSDTGFVVGDTQHRGSVSLLPVKGDSITIEKETGTTTNEILYKYTFVEDK